MHDGSKRRIAVCGQRSATSLSGLPHHYYQIHSDNLLPMASLYRDGFLNSNTAWFIATTPEVHVVYILELAGLCGRVFVEKPIAASYRQAQVLLPYAANQAAIYPVDHKMFTAESLAFVDRFRCDPALVDGIGSIEGEFLERSGFTPGRAQENSITDVQWHQLMLLVAVYGSSGYEFELKIDSVDASRYLSDPDAAYADAHAWTASCLRGRVLSAGREIPFHLGQAKAAPREEKSIRFFGVDGEELTRVDLSESGWQAHGRVLNSMFQPVVDMRHTLSDAIAMAELLEGAISMVDDHGGYAFGSLPGFLIVAADCRS
jgi:hypothetical protein